MKCTQVCVLLVLLGVCVADLYMHNPRGCNNRLNEKSANRNNGNRLFDSQNNNRGGYNVGDRTKTASTSKATQAQMEYYEGSVLPVEWTNQHGCGTNEKLKCEIIHQYSCIDGLRDGTTTTTPTETDSDKDTGRHETAAYYADCKARARNMGLFTADQDLQDVDARFTRQNPGGTRRGLECPEERDYYPYWHPTMWTDIAVQTSTPQRCPMYQTQSQNVKAKGYCEEPEFNNPTDCPNGKWKEEPSWSTIRGGLVTAPECSMSPWSRDNHLGNGPDGVPSQYNWTLPSPEAACGKAECTCVYRMRYNISTSDTNWALNSSYNGDQNVRDGQPSPVRDNPTIRLDDSMNALQLALNTDQFSRAFQDRSHTFVIKKRPAQVPAGAKIFNLNVRGKRCNIVECFPAVEYDFMPPHLYITEGDWVHVQWVGSNTHNNGNPAGDGQAGDSGQGTSGTDRHNMVQIDSANENYPTAYANLTMWPASPDDTIPSRAYKELVVEMATAGYPGTDDLLNDAPAYFDGGLVRFRGKGKTYHYMATRNNSFSNRSQKGKITVL